MDELKDVARSLRRLPVVEPELPTVRRAGGAAPRGAGRASVAAGDNPQLASVAAGDNPQLSAAALVLQRTGQEQDGGQDC